MNFKDYQALGFSKLTQPQFESQLSDATYLIDNLTGDFYVMNDLIDDLTSVVSFFVYRGKQYEKAIALQCEFAEQAGASTPLEQSMGAPKNITVGKSTLTYDSNAIVTATYGSTGVVKTAVDILARTGLLSRVVSAR